MAVYPTGALPSVSVGTHDNADYHRHPVIIWLEAQQTVLCCGDVEDHDHDQDLHDNGDGHKDGDGDGLMEEEEEEEEEEEKKK